MQLMPQRLPADIESQSFVIIDSLFEGKRPFAGGAWDVARRIIHAAGDITLAEDLHLPDEAIAAGVAALADGAPIFTDTMMLKAGVSRKRLPRDNEVRCILECSDTTREAESGRCTRARAGMMHLGDALNGSVVAIGNAPTALLALLELHETRNVRPALVIGMPVGFVNAAESKELLLAEPRLAGLAVRGRRGGSPLAAAAVNALAILARAKNAG